MLKPTLAALAVLLAHPVQAQQAQCTDAENLHRILVQKYGESPISGSNCRVLGTPGQCVMWRNNAAGSWTFVFYPGDGRACPVGDGVSQQEPA